MTRDREREGLRPSAARVNELALVVLYVTTPEEKYYACLVAVSQEAKRARLLEVEAIIDML